MDKSASLHLCAEWWQSESGRRVAELAEAPILPALTPIGAMIFARDA